MSEPAFGFTSSGEPVHAKTTDHHVSETRYQRFNKRVAIWLTKNVGTMTAFWLFWIACFTILPSCLHLMGVIGSRWIGPSFMIGFGFNLLMTWLLSTCLELTLMPAIMVGQNLQNEAADVRAAKTFEEVEELRHLCYRILDLLEAEDV